MAGNTNFPTALDDDSSLLDVTDNVSALIASHHNNTKEAVKALEAKVGIYSTSSPTSVDYRLGNPTGGHKHDGASGHSPQINPTAITVPSGGVPSGGTLHDHLMDSAAHGGVGGGVRHIVPWDRAGSLASGASYGHPFSFGRTVQLESVHVRFRRGPSGATTALDVNFGPTSVWQASQGNRPIFPAGSAYYAHASPNLITYPSGTLIAIDVDAVGNQTPGEDLGITFIFRE